LPDWSTGRPEREQIPGLGPRKWNMGERHSQYIPPQLANGHTMVPARRVAEAMGADVQWDQFKI